MKSIVFPMSGRRDEISDSERGSKEVVDVGAPILRWDCSTGACGRGNSSNEGNRGNFSF